MPEDLKIDYLELPARDIPAVQAFYQTVFGWKFTDYGPEYCSFEDGRMTGGFFQSDAHSATENGAALIVVYASDLEKCRDAVVAAGGAIAKEIFSFPGGRRFQFTDPNGNELAVWTDQGLEA